MTDLIMSSSGAGPKRLKDMGNGTYAEVVAAVLDYVRWTQISGAQASSTTIVEDCTLFADVEIEVFGLSGDIALKRSSDGTTANPAKIYDWANNPINLITQDGIYRLTASAILSLVLTGTLTKVMMRKGQ